jgi:hypothetical protein
MTIQPTQLNPIKPVVDAYLLDHSHRCDTCGARAYVHTILTSAGELFWCRHHWLAAQPGILGKCLYVNDETRALFEHIKDDHWVEGKAVSLPPRKTF